jgi:long-chain acyl-CoA synthetase
MTRGTLLDFFEDFTQRDDVFIVHDDGYRVRQLTYRDLASEARGFAARLVAAGIGPDQKVVVWSENRPEWVIALWGCLLARVVIVPVDFRASPDLVNRIADIVDAKLILVGDEVAEVVTKRPVRRLAEETTVSAPSAPLPPAFASVSSAPSAPPEPTSLAEIIFTSGATADPKGVTITHRNILANTVPIEREMAKYRKYMRPFHPIRFLNLLPLSHMFGQSMATFVPPMMAGTVVFSHGYSPTEILRQIKSRRLSVLVCVPKVLDVLREHVQRVAPITAEVDTLAGKHWSWRWWKYRKVHKLFGWKFWCVVCGAAPLDPELEGFWRKLGFLVVQGYGLTETAPIVTLNHPLRASSGSVGRPIHGVEIKIAPDGEILVKGENVTSGYYQAPGRSPAEVEGQGTESAFDEGGFFHTGDIGELDSEGRLLIKGRKKEMIVTPQGLNVFPEDVERALLAQPGVKDAAVVALRVEGEERVHAVLILQPGADEHAIVRRANATLEDHQRVWSTSIWPGETLPRTEGTQKLKRREIQRWAAGESAGKPAVAAGTSVESIVARFASGRDITPDTTMDELGLTSLDRVELMMALEEAFQTTLDESALATAKTVGDLRGLIGVGSSVPGSGFRVRESGLEPANQTNELRNPGTRNLEPRSPETRNPEPGTNINFPSWNRTSLSWLLRRISLPSWILPLARPFMKLKVEGVDYLTNLKGPVIFAVNHQSHMDTPAVMLAMPAEWRYRIAPAMMKEFFKPHFFPREFTRKKVFWNSLWYYLACQFFNAFPIPQKEAGTRQTLRYIGDVLADNYSVLIFPEGARHKEGEIAPFMPGIGMMGARLGVPVVPVRIEGLDKVLHPKMKWPKRGPVRVAFGAPLKLEGEDYAALAKRVEEAVRGL